jgi:transketolase
MNKAPALLGSSGDSLREACGKELTKIAPEYPNVVVLDADVAGGTGMHHFRTTFPDRFIQCGIAEQNMMAMAGGLAATGLIPVVTTFSVFMLRSIEQARLSIAYAKMNVKIVASHPGLDVGPDGASAQCLEDLACYRSIPNMVVLSPCDPLEIEQATKAILEYDGPVYMRTGRSDAQRILGEDYHFEIGKGRILREGSDVTIMGCGVTTGRALEAANILEKNGVSARVVNMSTIKPIDSDMVIKCANETLGIIAVEDHNIIGGLGSAVAEVLVKNRPAPMEIVGVNDSFGESGEPDELAAKYGIDSTGVIAAVHRLLERVK